MRTDVRVISVRCGAALIRLIACLTTAATAAATAAAATSRLSASTTTTILWLRCRTPGCSVHTCARARACTRHQGLVGQHLPQWRVHSVCVRRVCMGCCTVPCAARVRARRASAHTTQVRCACNTLTCQLEVAQRWPACAQDPRWLQLLQAALLASVSVLLVRPAPLAAGHDPGGPAEHPTASSA